MNWLNIVCVFINCILLVNFFIRGVVFIIGSLLFFYVRKCGLLEIMVKILVLFGF